MKGDAEMNITINDIVALSNAGFSKAEILALTAQPTVAQPTVVQPTAQPTVAQPTVVQPTAQPGNGVSMSNEQFTALLQSINAGNASIDLPPTYDINNVLADHYKALMVGDSQKKGE